MRAADVQELTFCFSVVDWDGTFERCLGRWVLPTALSLSKSELCTLGLTVERNRTGKWPLEITTQG